MKTYSKGLLFIGLIVIGFYFLSKSKLSEKTNLIIPELIKIDPGGFNNQISLDSIFSPVDLIQVNLHNKFSIKDFHRIDFFNEKLLVYDLDQEDVFLLNKEGELIQKLGKKGKGPGEFAGINDVQFNSYSNTVDILSSVQRNIHKYDAETGRLVEVLNYNPDGQTIPYLSSFTPIGKNQYYFSNSEFHPANNQDWNYHFFLLDFKEKKVLNRWLPFQDFEQTVNDGVFVPQRAFQSEGDKVLANYWNSDILFELNPDQVTPKYKFDFQNTKFVNNIFGVADLETVYAEKSVCCIEPIISTKDYIFGSYRFKNPLGEGFIYSKKTKKVVQFNLANLTSNAHKFAFPIGFRNNELVFLIYPEDVLSGLESETNSIEFKQFWELKKRKIKFTQNEILLFYKIKDF